MVFMSSMRWGCVVPRDPNKRDNETRRVNEGKMGIEPKSEDTSSAFPSLYLLLENPRKSNCLGPILRCASAFGIRTVVAVGYDKCSVEGSHGASKHVEIIAFPTSDQAVVFLRKDCECETIVGLLGSAPNAYETTAVFHDAQLDLVRLSSGSKTTSQAKGREDRGVDPSKEDLFAMESSPVDTRPFPSKGNICIALSKEKKGLPFALAKHCDRFVHVPHFGIGDLQLDCPACFSITLHEYTEHIGYNERDFNGHKFDVTKRQHSTSNESKREERVKDKREKAAEAQAGDSSLGNFFGPDMGGGDY